MTIADLDFDYFKQFFEKRYAEFGGNPPIKYPEFTVKAGSLPGTSSSVFVIQ